MDTAPEFKWSYDRTNFSDKVADGSISHSKYPLLFVLASENKVKDIYLHIPAEAKEACRQPWHPRNRAKAHETKRFHALFLPTHKST